MNWDSQKSKDLLDNDEIAIMSMKVLQSYVWALSRFPQTLFSDVTQIIGRKASNIYEDGKPQSVELTISSLMFGNGEKGCEVRDFFLITIAWADIESK